MGEVQEFLEFVKTKLVSSGKESLDSIHKQHNAIISKAAATGTLGSGRMFLIIAELFENQLKIRSRTILSTVQEVSQGFDLNKDVEREIETYCLQRLEEEKHHLVKAMLGVTPFKQTGFMKETQLQAITAERVASIEKAYEQEQRLLSTELKLFFRKQNMAKKEVKNGPILNISGNIGQLQVGDQNIMIIDQSQKTILSNAFTEIRETLEGSELMEATKYREINELMLECEGEIEKENPNRSRIGACLGTIGQAIGGIATLGSAYQALKMFVPLFGGPPLP